MKPPSAESSKSAEPPDRTDTAKSATSAPSMPLSSPTDADLIRRVLEGDRAAFEGIYLRYRHSLLLFLASRYRSLDDHTIDDVVGEVFLRIWVRRHLLGAVGNLRGYLRSVANSIAADGFRRQHLALTELPANSPSSTEPSSVARERSQVADELASGMASLATSHRLVLELRAEGLSAKQIALVVECTEKAARDRLAKARKRMREALSS